VEKISEEIAQSAFSATQSIQTARNGTNVAQANLNAVANLRKQIHESIKRIQKLTESSQEIGKIAKTVEDLAQRTSMVALNASIQAVELNENGRGFAIVSEEVERLAKRANDTNKSISSLNKSIQSEINKVESSLENTVSEVANLSKFALETTNAIDELERYVTQFLGLQEKISSYTLEQNDDAERAFETFVGSIGETEESVRILKQSADSVQRITNSMDGLQISVAHVKASSAESRGVPKNSFSNPIEAPELSNF
jgi:twitching motility protein PilJ